MENLIESNFYPFCICVRVDHEILKNEHSTTEHGDGGVDIENDDDTPSLLNGDLDGNDHDSNDMGRPRKIRR